MMLGHIRFEGHGAAIGSEAWSTDEGAELGTGSVSIQEGGVHPGGRSTAMTGFRVQSGQAELEKGPPNSVPERPHPWHSRMQFQ